jgi:hypothetical protein
MPYRAIARRIAFLHGGARSAAISRALMAS